MAGDFKERRSVLQSKPDSQKVEFCPEGFKKEKIGEPYKLDI